MKKIIFGLIMLTVTISCHPPANYPPPEPPPECDMQNTGSFNISELRLNYDYSLAPSSYTHDHPDDPISNFYEVMDENFNADDDNANIKVTVAGTECTGVGTTTYNKNGGGYGASSLDETPVPSQSYAYLCKTIIEVTSAEYQERYLFWKKEYNEVLGHSSTFWDGEFNGIWMFKDKLGYNGTLRKVYVYGTFNEYIYMI